VTSMELVVRAAKESSDDFYDMQFLEVASRASGQILSGFFPINNFCQGFVSKNLFVWDYHSLRLALFEPQLSATSICCALHQ